jgi:hypothetical protein
LRHTHVSVLIATGTDILKISRRLGHDKPSTTLNVYGHLIKDRDDEMVKALEGLLKIVRRGENETFVGGCGSTFPNLVLVEMFQRVRR